MSYLTEPQQYAQTQPQAGVSAAVVLYQLPPQHYTRPDTKYLPDSLKSKVLIFGIIQVVLGIIEIILSCVYFTSIYYSGPWFIDVVLGFFAGTFYIFTGGFGIHAAKAQTKCLSITSRVMSIISSVIGVLSLIIGLVYFRFIGIPEGVRMFFYLVVMIASICQACFFCCCRGRDDQPSIPVQYLVPAQPYPQNQPYVVNPNYQQQPQHQPYVNAGYSVDGSAEPQNPELKTQVK